MVLTNIFIRCIKPPVNTLLQIKITDERKSLSAKRNMKLLTTEESADRLGITKRRVQAMIRSGRLLAEKMGRDWFIREEDLALVADRKPGRPPLTDEEKAARAKKRSAAAQASLFEQTTAAKPKAGAKKAGVKKATKKKGARAK